LSGDVIKSLFNICSRINFLFRELELELLEDLLDVYRDKQQDTDERTSSPVSPGLGEFLVSWYFLGILSPKHWQA
jgi:hypothetical protein